MRVVIIGAGIAGLSTAVGLARQGIEVDVVEADSPQERTGAGISLLGNALRALGELDLADPCLDAGYGFDTIDIVDGDGNVMMSDRAPRSFRADRPASFGILRSTLHSVLADGAERAGARLCYQCTVTSMEQDDAGVDVTLSTGEQLRADLVVAADGTYSSTRAAVFGAEFAPEYVGQGVWRITFPRPEHLHGLVLMRNKAGQAAGAIPLSDELCYVFILENASRTSAHGRRHASRVDGRPPARVHGTADACRRRGDPRWQPHLPAVRHSVDAEAVAPRTRRVDR